MASSIASRPYMVIRLEDADPAPVVVCAACNQEGPLGVWLTQPVQSRLLVIADQASPLTGAVLAVCASCDPGWPNRAEVDPRPLLGAR
jgi:hypothetical protein